MRFLRVTFRCFGPFEEQALDLCGAGSLQVIFGANETGKSSAHRGLNAFLFGFPGQSNDDFRFKYSQFRVHGLLENRAGEQLECIRRKGHKETLRKNCDKAVFPDRQLTDFIGGLDRNQFEQLFGLDAERLVAGGSEIAQGQGELGEALFAAGAGMKGLRILSKKLDDRQNQLYLPGGRNQKITEALRQHRDLVDKSRSLALPPDTYAAAESAARNARDQVERLTEERRQVRARRDLLNRYKASLPTIDLLRTARERLAPVADAPLLSAEFDVRLESAREKLNGATAEIAALEKDQHTLKEQIEEHQLPAALLREEAEIDELKMQVGADVKLRGEEVRAGTFSIDERGKARDIFRELTGSTDWERMDALKPRLDQRTAIQELANQRSAIVQDVERQEAAVHDAAKLLEVAGSALAQMPNPEDPTPWQELVDEIAALGPVEKQHEELEKAVQLEERRLEAEFVRFQPAPTISWREAPALPVPLAETIDRFREETQVAISNVSQLEEQQAETRRELESLQLSLVNKVGTEPVPTVDELTSARGDRDRGLQGIRTRLAGQPEAQLETDFSNRHAPGRPLIDAVEASVGHCDTLSDRLRHEADRVAAFQSLQQQEGVLRGRLTDLDAAVSVAKTRLDAIIQRWREVWAPAGVVPEAPKVMQPWLGNWSRFRDRVMAWQDNSRHCQEEKARIDRLRVRLADACPPAHHAKTLGEALAAARRAVTDLTSVREKMARLVEDIQRLQKQRQEAGERHTRALQRRREWDEHWAAAVAVLQLKEAVPSIETAQSYLARIDALQQHLRDMRIKDARVREIQEDRKLLVGRLNFLRTRLDPGARPTSTETLDSDFHSVEVALDAAREQRTRHGELSKQIHENEKRRLAATQRLADARAALQALADEARVQVDALPTAVQRARERAEAAKLVREYEEALAHSAQGKPMQPFEADALAVRSELDQQLADLEHHVNQLDADVSQAEAAARDADRVLDGYRQASGAAAEAKQEVASLTARLEEQIKEFAALHLARAALDKAKDRYRARHQDTLLDRAGAFFKTLTNGAFSGIEVDYDEGQDILKAVRASVTRTDGRVSVDGLSDGTRDQLFLSLRLAGIEQHLREREPAPLIVDDALINFDDDRARATLRCLAELAKQTQVIVFTHHRHIVDLAREVAPATHVLDLAQPA